MMPRFLAERIAPELNALVAPTLSYGFKSQPKSGGGNHFPGCVSLDATTYISLVKDVICDFARHGLTRITLFDGHMENQWFLTEAADLALRALKAEGVEDVKIVKLGYWVYLTQATENILFPEGLLSWELEHAAVMETSVMLHLAPEMVRANLIPDGPPADFPLYDLYPADTRPIPETGVLSSAKNASADKGQAVVAQVVPDIAAALKQAFGLEGQSI